MRILVALFAFTLGSCLAAQELPKGEELPAVPKANEKSVATSVQPERATHAVVPGRYGLGLQPAD